MKKPELLAPAGDLHRLKIAVLYGADAVFLGGEMFSLRAKANNFSIEDIAKGVNFAHKHHAKVYVTVNIIPHDDDFNNLEKYLIELDKAHIDAIIVTSLEAIDIVKKMNLSFEIHISTQQSICNSSAIEFFKRRGAKRVVLGREVNVDQMRLIKSKTDMPLEVFIHGGMCSSYSGRCFLSNTMCERDANKGGCAHSCRWSYRLQHNNKKVNDKDFILASRDLSGATMIKELMDIGIESFKIEGRMRSDYYVAMVVFAYRNLIDSILEGKDYAYNLRKTKRLLSYAENRELGIGFLKPKLSHENLLDKLTDGTPPSQDFVAYVIEDNKKGLLKVIERNRFMVGDKLLVLSYGSKLKTIEIKKMYDEKMQEIDVANHAQMIVYIQTKSKIKANSFLIKKKRLVLFFLT